MNVIQQILRQRSFLNFDCQINADRKERFVEWTLRDARFNVIRLSSDLLKPARHPGRVVPSLSRPGKNGTRGKRDSSPASWGTNILRRRGAFNAREHNFHRRETGGGELFFKARSDSACHSTEKSGGERERERDRKRKSNETRSRVVRKRKEFQNAMRHTRWHVIDGKEMKLRSTGGNTSVRAKRIS